MFRKVLQMHCEHSYNEFGLLHKRLRLHIFLLFFPPFVILASINERIVAICDSLEFLKCCFYDRE